jgi:glycosyltransferase involved in cell wall biosynthesis
LNIAILGTRGIPAAYGGFETLAWELSTRLAERGHEVTVYCRRGRTDESTEVPPGIHRRFLPYLPGKYLETVSHTGLSVLDSILRGYDAIWLGNAANAVFAGLPRLRGTVVALNVDGIERQRAKWGPAGRAWYAVGERLALRFPNAIVSDAQVIHDYYLERYQKASVVIAYGAPLLERDPAPDLSRHGPALEGIEPGRYILYVSRLEPENQADLVIRAYRDVPGDVPLLIVGDAPHASAFKARLAELAAADSRVRLTGAIYGDAYRDLQRAALLYVQATSVGGTHPALIEAMGAGNLVLAFGSPENREVTGGTALLFDDAAGLADHLRAVLEQPQSNEFVRMRSMARLRVESHYSWDAVTSQYEQLWQRLRAGR